MSSSSLMCWSSHKSRWVKHYFLIGTWNLLWNSVHTYLAYHGIRLNITGETPSLHRQEYAHIPWYVSNAICKHKGLLFASWNSTAHGGEGQKKCHKWNEIFYWTWKGTYGNEGNLSLVHAKLLTTLFYVLTTKCSIHCCNYEFLDWEQIIGLRKKCNSFFSYSVFFQTNFKKLIYV